MFHQCAITLGLSLFFLNCTYLSSLENIKDALSFGNKQSEIEVYFFSGFDCPSCRKVEPLIEALEPEIGKKSRILFVEDIFQEEASSYTPYNLSFMVHNKDQYFKLKEMLNKLAEESVKPTLELIQEKAKALGATYTPLDAADVTSGIEYFKLLGKQFDIEGTPILVILNKTTKKGKKLVGAKEITQENITKVMAEL